MHWRGQVFSPYLSLLLLTIEMPDFGNSAMLVTKSGTTWEECETLCRVERDIDCSYYKFSRDKTMCLMTATYDKAVTGLRKLDKADSLADLQTRVTTLEIKINDAKSLKKDIKELKAEITSLKNSRALTHHLLRSTKDQIEQNIAAIDEKTELIKTEAKRVEDAMMTMGEMQKTFGKKIRKINEELRATSITVTVLSQSSKDVRSSIREVAASLSELQSGLSRERKTTTDLQVRFASLSSDVMEKVASVDTMIGPDLKDLRDAQTTLAQALSLLTKKIMKLMPRIPALHKELSKKEGLLSILDSKVKSFGREVSFLNERLSFTEQELKKVIDPSSKLNVDRRQMVTRLRSQVASLLDSQTRMQNDILIEISDRSRLYKELSELKISRKALIDKVSVLETAVQHFRSTLRHLSTDGPNGKLVSNILNRQVAALKSLKKLRDTQAEVQGALQRYKLSMIRAHKDMVERDHRRKMNELQLRRLQVRLVNVYRKLRRAMVNNAQTRAVHQLLQQQKQSIYRLAKMQEMQFALQRELSKHKMNLKAAKAILKAQKDEHIKGLEKLEQLRDNTLSMYAELNAKMENFRKTEMIETAKQIGEIARRQMAVIKNLNNYRTRLVKTQEEIMAEKEEQVKVAKHNVELRKEMKRLNQALFRTYHRYIVDRREPPDEPEPRERRQRRRHRRSFDLEKPGKAKAAAALRRTARDLLHDMSAAHAAEISNHVKTLMEQHNKLNELTGVHSWNGRMWDPHIARVTAAARRATAAQEAAIAGVLQHAQDMHTADLGRLHDHVQTLMGHVHGLHHYMDDLYEHGNHLARVRNSMAQRNRLPGLYGHPLYQHYWGPFSDRVAYAAGHAAATRNLQSVMDLHAHAAHLHDRLYRPWRFYDNGDNREADLSNLHDHIRTVLSRRNRLTYRNRYPLWLGYMGMSDKKLRKMRKNLKAIEKHKDKLDKLEKENRDIMSLAALNESVQSFLDHQYRLDALERRLQELYSAHP